MTGLKSTMSNLIGNISGSITLNGQGTENALIVSPTTRTYSGVFYDYNYGYWSIGDTGNTAGNCASTGACPPYITSLIHGDYAHGSNTTTWATGITHTLPASFYLASKPSWFGSVPWPAIGPDVAGGLSDAVGYVYAIPAQVCYNNGAKDASGALIFDPVTCYSAQQTPPTPPTGLSVVVR
jgi:hypothetical protein